jgi:hypothetical protein
MTTHAVATGVFPFIAADSPELALLAAVIKLAVEDAQAGDDEARAWLASPDCRGMLSWPVPAHADLDAAYAALLLLATP